MSYYLLPRTTIFTYKNIKCSTTVEFPTPVISNSLSKYLYEIKKKLDKQEKEWDIYKNILIHMNIYTLLYHIIKNAFQNTNHYLDHILK